MGVSSSSASAMRVTNMVATASLLCGGQASTPDARTSVIVLRSPPITPDCGETSLARIQSQCLRASFALALATTFSVSAAKPIPSFGRCFFRPAVVAGMSGFFSSGDGGENVGIFDERELWARMARLFFQLVFSGIGDAPVGDCSGEDGYVGGERALDRPQHLACVFDLDHFRAGWIGHIHRTADQSDIGAGVDCRCRDSMPLFSGGAIGDVTDRIDPLLSLAPNDP